MLFFSHSLIIFFLMSPSSCEQVEYSNDSRIFVEGKINSPCAEGVQIKLNLSDILISETKSNADRTFKLGGRGTSAFKFLSFDQKIKSFTSDNPGYKLSSDSLSIILPNETYFRFTQINMQP